MAFNSVLIDFLTVLHSDNRINAMFVEIILSYLVQINVL